MNFLLELKTKCLFALAGFFFAILLAEIALRIYNPFELPQAQVISITDETTGKIRKSDPDLGQINRENQSVHDRLIVDGKEVISAVYTTNEYGQRVSPQNSADKKLFAVFTGSSNVFSWGVNDAEAWPNLFGEKSGVFNIYNYGIKASGPQILPLLTKKMIDNREVAEKKGLYFYFFTDDHIKRMVGTFHSSQMSLDFLYYELGENGEPRKLGTFKKDRPILSSVYRWLWQLKVMHLWNFDIPFGVRQKDLLLLAKLVKASYSEFKRANPDSLYYVLLLQGDLTNEVRSALEREGIPSLTVSYPPRENNFIPVDGHLTKSGCELFSETILEKVSQEPLIADFIKNAAAK